RHRQRPEAVHDPLGHICCEGSRGADEPEGDRLHQDSADQVLAVLAVRHADHATEDEAEQQHEHQRLEGHVEELLGDLADVGEVASRDLDAVGEQPTGARCYPGSRFDLVNGHAATASSRFWPVSVRIKKTSSRVASRRATSIASTWAPSSARTTSIS